MEFDFGDDAPRAVTKVIDRAEKALYLVTPYITPWKRLVTSLKVAHSKGVKIVVVLRGGADRAKQEDNAAPIKDIAKLVFAENLHAKMYLSEREAVVSSMNLLVSSVNGSWEFAVRIDREGDPEMYDKVYKAVRLIADITKVTDAPAPETSRAREPERATTPKFNKPVEKEPDPTDAEGHCISCGGGLAFNTKKPMCWPCYSHFSKDENEKQSHCHKCGKERSTSMRKPVCRKCYDEMPT